MVKFIAFFTKENERYVFAFRPSELQLILDSLGDLVQDEELNFGDTEADLVSQILRDCVDGIL